MTWRHIMFGVATPDRPEPSAMGKAARLASALDAELELFHCVFDPDVGRVPLIGWRAIEPDIRDTVEQRRRRLEAAAERLRAEGVVVRTTVRWDDPPYEGIVRQVLRHKPDLLVVQSTRRSRAARLVLTHTDYRLIEACPCPLLLIKTPRPYLDARVVAAVDPLHTHDKPAALDDAILDAASAVSQALGGELHVFHACVPWPVVAGRSGQLRRLAEAVQPEVSARYRETTEARVAEVARRQLVPKRRVHIEAGRAVESLPRFAKSICADIVAMGAVSRSLPKRALIGPTAERVLDALDCDVLIAKPPGFRSPVSRRSVHRLPKRGAQRARYVL